MSNFLTVRQQINDSWSKNPDQGWIEARVGPRAATKIWAPHVHNHTRLWSVHDYGAL